MEFFFFCMTSLVWLVPGVLLYEVIYAWVCTKALGVSQARFPLRYYDDLC